MKVNVAGVWYDANEQPLAVELNQSDKNNISKMLITADTYVSYPSNLDWLEVRTKLGLENLDNFYAKQLTNAQLGDVKRLVDDIVYKCLGESYQATEIKEEIFTRITSIFQK